MNLEVCLNPSDYRKENYRQSTAVVIDVLRATTCIATAFTNGCRQMIPVKTVEEAVAKKKELFPDALLTGERKGLLIPGFNLGNSPREYQPEVVKGKTVVMTTTNGTVALNKAANSLHVYTAAFVNAAAVCKKLQKNDSDVVILCAGIEGRFSLEDALCAGLLADRLSLNFRLSDTALAAQAMYLGYKDDLVNRMLVSSHAQYLVKIGFGQDIPLCLTHDVLDVTPTFQQGILHI